MCCTSLLSARQLCISHRSKVEALHQVPSYNNASLDPDGSFQSRSDERLTLHFDCQLANPHAHRCRHPYFHSCTNRARVHLDGNHVPSTCLTGVPANVSVMFASPAWLCAPSVPHVVRPTKVLMPTHQAVEHTVFSTADFSDEKSLRVVYKCRGLLLSLQNNPSQCQVPRNLSLCTWISTPLVFSSCPPSVRHNMRTTRQLISAHLLVNLHTVQEVELLFASLLLGDYRHVLLSLNEALCRHTCAVATFSRVFERDTREIERARLRVHSTRTS